jgi:hypothetical protein
MAKSSRKAKEQDTDTNGTATAASSADSGEQSTSGYFRRLFQENPRLLKSRSNEEILNRWLADHPEMTEVPQNVKNNLANLKSVLRKKMRVKGAKKRAAATAAAPQTRKEAPARKASTRPLESLEEQIDECLTLAKTLDPQGLEDVIRLLRRARNQVVWQLGQ